MLLKKVSQCWGPIHLAEALSYRVAGDRLAAAA
jgi:hypothetical protein